MASKTWFRSLTARTFRERRRAVVTVVLAFLAVLASEAFHHSAFLVAGVYTCVGTTLAVVVPRLRALPMIFALAVLGAALLHRAVPETPFDMFGSSAGAETILMAIASWLGIAGLLARGLRALPVPRWKAVSLKAHAPSPLSVEHLWSGVLSGVGARAAPGRETCTVLSTDAPFHARLATQARDTTGAVVSQGESEIFLVDLGPSRLVLFNHQFDALPFGAVCLAWLDDQTGRMLDKRLDEIAALVHRELHFDPRSTSTLTDIAAWDLDAAKDFEAQSENGGEVWDTPPEEVRKAS